MNSINFFNHLTFLLLSLNYFILTSSKDLKVPAVIYDNGLTEAEKDLALASAMRAVEQTTDKATISKSIVADLTGKFGGKWNSFVTSANLDNSGFTIQSYQLIRFVQNSYEITVFKSEASNSTESFNDVLNVAKHSQIKQNYLLDTNGTLKDVLVIVNHSLYIDLSNCQRYEIGWIDFFGDCYRLIADDIEERLEYKYGGKWSITVGEIHSHFQSWSDALVTYIENYYYFVAQFNYGNLHFNIIHSK